MRRTVLTRLLLILVLAIGAWLQAGPAPAKNWVADFDHLPLAPGSYFNGADLSGGFYGDADSESWFVNNYNPTYASWDGFAYSNVNDTTTPGWTNQYAAFTGTDQSGSGNYGVGYDPSASGFGSPPMVTLADPVPQVIAGAWFTNTTYAALAMLNGDSFSKKFGGPGDPHGNDPDWFLLEVYGIDAGGGQTGPVPFYLADYRSPDNAQDYVVDDWRWVDLRPLGEVVGLEFRLSSSDTGQFGMNTPAYFAVDGVNALPEPSTALMLLAAAAVGLLWRNRRR